MFWSFNAIIFYTCLSFYSIVRACFIMGEKEDLKFGWVYVIFGILCFIYFLLNMGYRFTLLDSWIIVTLWGPLGFFELFVIFFVMVVSSFVLVVLGLVLLDHSGLWLARLSGVLCGFLIICFIYVNLPYTILSR